MLPAWAQVYGGLQQLMSVAEYSTSSNDSLLPPIQEIEEQLEKELKTDKNEVGPLQFKPTDKANDE